jgi:hypothetical protein
MCATDGPSAVFHYDDDPLPGTSAIEAVIAAAGDDPQRYAVIRRLVERSSSYVLGQGALGGTHLYPLRAEVPMGYQTITMLPAFTRFRFADEAILMNPTWIFLGTWIMKGTQLTRCGMGGATVSP